MNEYRVTKYDPQYRVNGAYSRNEWTSISDVGRIYDGKTFTLEEYDQVEQRYVDFLLELSEMCGVFPLQVDSYDEVYRNGSWQVGQETCRMDLSDIVASILREECWCRLLSQDFFIHFGYELYMYVGCGLSFDEMSELAYRHCLFCEQFCSPYHNEEDVECSSAP